MFFSQFVGPDPLRMGSMDKIGLAPYKFWGFTQGIENGYKGGRKEPLVTAAGRSFPSRALGVAGSGLDGKRDLLDRARPFL